MPDDSAASARAKMTIRPQPVTSADCRRRCPLPHRGRHGWPPLAGVLYSLTIFLSRFLLFQIQPLIGKFILPWFGGTPGVWTTCMLVFQLLLFGGYAYAHLTVSRLSPRAQAALHIVLLLAALPGAAGRSQHLAWKPAGRRSSRSRGSWFSWERRSDCRFLCCRPRARCCRDGSAGPIPVAHRIVCTPSRTWDRFWRSFPFQPCSTGSLRRRRSRTCGRRALAGFALLCACQCGERRPTNATLDANRTN